MIMSSKIKLFFCKTGFSLFLLSVGIFKVVHANSASEKRRNNTEKNPQDLVVSGSVKDGENR